MIELDSQAMSYYTKVAEIAKKTRHENIIAIARDVLHYTNDIKSCIIKCFDDWESSGAGLSAMMSTLEAGEEAENLVRSEEERLRQCWDKLSNAYVYELDGVEMGNPDFTPGVEDYQLLILTRQYVTELDNIDSTYKAIIVQKKAENSIFICLGSLVESTMCAIRTATMHGNVSSFEIMIAHIADINASRQDGKDLTDQLRLKSGDHSSGANDIRKKTKNRWKKNASIPISVSGNDLQDPVGLKVKMNEKNSDFKDSARKLTISILKPDRSGYDIFKNSVGLFSKANDYLNAKYEYENTKQGVMYTIYNLARKPLNAIGKFYKALDTSDKAFSAVEEIMKAYEIDTSSELFKLIKPLIVVGGALIPTTAGALSNKVANKLKSINDSGMLKVINSASKVASTTIKMISIINTETSPLKAIKTASSFITDAIDLIKNTAEYTEKNNKHITDKRVDGVLHKLGSEIISYNAAMDQYKIAKEKNIQGVEKPKGHPFVVATNFVSRVKKHFDDFYDYYYATHPKKDEEKT